MAKGKVLSFLPSRTPSEKDIFEEGKLGALDYKVFKRGVVHISSKGFVFKKDVDLFETEVSALDLNNMKEGKEKRIKGSGDNDDLVFRCKSDDIEVTLEHKQYSTVEKLKGILFRGRQKKKEVA